MHLNMNTSHNEELHIQQRNPEATLTKVRSRRRRQKVSPTRSSTRGDLSPNRQKQQQHLSPEKDGSERCLDRLSMEDSVIIAGLTPLRLQRSTSTPTTTGREPNVANPVTGMNTLRRQGTPATGVLPTPYGAKGCGHSHKGCGHSHASLDFSIQVIKADNLAACDTTRVFGKGKRDPYVVVSILTEDDVILVGRTSPYPATVKPQWNANITKVLPAGTFASDTYVVELKLMDYDIIGSHPCLGVVRIPMGVDGVTKPEEWYEIPWNSAEKACGRIQVALETKLLYSMDSFVNNSSNIGRTTSRSDGTYVLLDEEMRKGQREEMMLHTKKENSVMAVFGASSANLMGAGAAVATTALEAGTAATTAALGAGTMVATTAMSAGTVATTASIGACTAVATTALNAGTVATTAALGAGTKVATTAKSAGTVATSAAVGAGTAATSAASLMLGAGSAVATTALGAGTAATKGAGFAASVAAISVAKALAKPLILKRKISQNEAFAEMVDSEQFTVVSGEETTTAAFPDEKMNVMTRTKISDQDSAESNNEVDELQAAIDAAVLVAGSGHRSSGGKRRIRKTKSNPGVTEEPRHRSRSRRYSEAVKRTESQSRRSSKGSEESDKPKTRRKSRRSRSQMPREEGESNKSRQRSHSTHAYSSKEKEDHDTEPGRNSNGEAESTKLQQRSHSTHAYTNKETEGRDTEPRRKSHDESDEKEKKHGSESRRRTRGEEKKKKRKSKSPLPSSLIARPGSRRASRTSGERKESERRRARSSHKGESSSRSHREGKKGPRKLLSDSTGSKLDASYSKSNSRMDVSASDLYSSKMDMSMSVSDLYSGRMDRSSMDMSASDLYSGRLDRSSMDMSASDLYSGKDQSTSSLYSSRREGSSRRKETDISTSRHSSRKDRSTRHRERDGSRSRSSRKMDGSKSTRHRTVDGSSKGHHSSRRMESSGRSHSRRRKSAHDDSARSLSLPDLTDPERRTGIDRQRV